MKTTMREIQDAVNQVWTNPHKVVDREALTSTPPRIHVLTVTDGLSSKPGSPSTRPADMRHPEWRAAFFRDSTAKSSDLSQRDIVLAALWAVKNCVTESVVIESWKDAGLHPFDPEGHKKW